MGKSLKEMNQIKCNGKECINSNDTQGIVNSNYIKRVQGNKMVQISMRFKTLWE